MRERKDREKTSVDIPRRSYSTYNKEQRRKYRYIPQSVKAGAGSNHIENGRGAEL